MEASFPIYAEEQSNMYVCVPLSAAFPAQVLKKMESIFIIWGNSLLNYLSYFPIAVAKHHVQDNL